MDQVLRTPRSTRLLKLSAASSSKVLSGELIEVDLDEKPQYDAISYTWGSDTASGVIRVNGTDMIVRQNLLDFLLQLQSHDGKLPLWIDAISIDQNQLDEKARQVAMIGGIFKQARAVLVWVGKHSDASEQLFTPWICPSGLCPVPSPKFETNKAWWRLFNQRIDIPSVDQAARFSTWLAFLRRPYFRRLWIVQEIVLAASIIVHCGDSCASWKELISSRAHVWMDFAWDGIELDRIPTRTENTSLNMVLEEDVTEFRDRLHDLMKLDKLRHERSYKGVPFIIHFKHAADIAYSHNDTNRQRASDIGHLNQLFPKFKCVDVRDHVYALLSLEKDAGIKADLEPDYRIDAAELFVRACVTRLATWKNLWVGYFAGLDPSCRQREFIESMEQVLLTGFKDFEAAVELCHQEVANSSERNGNMDLILTILRLSSKAHSGLELPDEQRTKMNKAYDNYKKRRQRINT